ncbi:MAG: phosphate ABC transporter permease subunit PstC [Syntrophales bacterium]
MNVLKRRRLLDAFTGASMRFPLLFVHVLFLAIGVGLFLKAWPLLAEVPIGSILGSESWHPLKGDFGLYPFIMGTLAVTALAMAISIPICLLSAVYLSEYAGTRFRESVRLAVDILAGIPSVIYGLCGILVIVPLVRELGEAIGIQTTGYSLLAGGIILAIMVAPFIIALTVEVFRTIPVEARESALALGTTRWEMVHHVLLRHARRGVMAAVVLGFSRAFGETMAVLMVVGNVPQVPGSLFDPAYPLPALIANNYGEMMSIPLYDAALMLAAFILLLVVSVFSLGAHFTLLRIGRFGV